jgi:hypothetical protein
METDDDIDVEDMARSAFGRSTQKKTKTATGNRNKPEEKTLVTDPDIATEVANKKYNFGLLFSKIGPTASTAVYSGDIESIIASVLNRDPEAYILPHNNSFVQAVGRKQFASMKGMDYTKFFDLRQIDWGSPVENKRKATFSFYVASEHLKEDLISLREDDTMKRALNDQNITMSRHKLLQSLDAPIGFLLGKTQQHTYRDEMEKRIQIHLQDSQAKQQLKEKGKPEFIPEGMELPPFIPVSAKPRTLQAGETKAEVITIFVGEHDHTLVKDLLKKYPFTGVNIIPYEFKKTHKGQWENHLEIHNILVNTSAAVKIMDADEKFRKLLTRRVDSDPAAKTHIIDVARRMRTAKDNTLYAQTTADSKEWVQQWLTSKISSICAANNLENQPYIETDYDSTRRSTEDQGTAPPTTVFHYLLQQPKHNSIKNTSQSATRGPSARKVPATIIIGRRPEKSQEQTTARSYSQIAQSQDAATKRSSKQSTVGSLGSPDRSTTSTVKTQREIELEEDLKSITSALETSRKVLVETQSSLARTQHDLKTSMEDNETIKEQMNQAIEEMKNQMENQKEETRMQKEKQDRLEVTFNNQLEAQRIQMQKMEEMMRQQMEMLNHQQNENQRQGTPLQTKKRLDTKETPPLRHSNTENNGIQQMAPQMQQPLYDYQYPHQSYHSPSHQSAQQYQPGMHAHGSYPYPGRTQYDLHDQHFVNQQMPPQRPHEMSQGPLQEGGPQYN